MDRFLLTLVRFALSAWFGAAVLFVITGIAEVRSPEFDSTTKNALAALRFPFYYQVGFTLVGAGLVAVWGLVCSGQRTLRGLRLAVASTTLAAVLMVVDYLWVFRPLLDMMSHEVKTESFETYHKASMYINAGGLLLVLVAAGVLCAGSLTDRKTQSPM